jgi:hypothetical protein
LKIKCLLFPINDWRFCEEYFGIIPQKYLSKVQATKEAFFNHYANSFNYASAIGWNGLNVAFGGKGNYSNLLPFDMGKDGGSVDGLNTPTQKTLEVLKSLHRTGDIPRAILCELGVSGILTKIAD